MAKTGWTKPGLERTTAPTALDIAWVAGMTIYSYQGPRRREQIRRALSGHQGGTP
jgi:hypothetical protein